MTKAEAIDVIYVEGVCRRQLHSAERRLTLQIKAILRTLKHDVDEDLEEDDDGGEEATTGVKPSEEMLPPSSLLESALAPVLTTLDEHRGALKKSRMEHERRLTALGEELPVWSEWAAGVRGISPLGLALIVCETGDLADYANPAKVWKRLGLAVIQGERQRRVTDPKLALEMGYSPRRRAVAWNVGGSFVKQGERYRELYLARKEKEAAKPPCGKQWRTKTGGTAKCEKDGHCRPKHIDARASRWMQKKFLADLWGAWNHQPEPVSRHHKSAA